MFYAERSSLDPEFNEHVREGAKEKMPFRWFSCTTDLSASHETTLRIEHPHDLYTCEHVLLGTNSHPPQPQTSTYIHPSVPLALGRVDFIALRWVYQVRVVYEG